MAAVRFNFLLPNADANVSSPSKINVNLVLCDVVVPLDNYLKCLLLLGDVVLCCINGVVFRVKNLLSSLSR